jgi:hypothetical protein
MNDYPTPWTPDVIEAFNALLTERPMLTYRQIAARLSEVNGWYFSKNSCIGYAKRIGVPNRKPGQPSRKGKTLKPRAKPHVPTTRLIAPHFKQQPSRRIGKLRIYELNHGECRWPVDAKTPYFFCGLRQVEGSSYCIEHTRRSCPAFARGR